MALGHGLDVPILAEGQELFRSKSSDLQGKATPILGQNRHVQTMSKGHNSL